MADNLDNISNIAARTCKKTPSLLLMIPTSEAISPSVQSVHALAKTFTIKKKKMTKMMNMMMKKKKEKKK